MPPPAVRVGPCDVGQGLFAGEEIEAGREILRLEGPELTLADVRAKGPLASNALQVGVNRYLDLREPGRLINHSCDPNAGIRDLVRVVAMTSIRKGGEIRFDYSTTIADGWTMPCRCGQPSCRGTVAAFLLLPPRLRLRYQILQVVQPFMVELLGM